MKVLAITPSRISLLGGGTDIDPYASQYGGVCLNMAINLRHQIVLDEKNLSMDFEEYDNPKFYQEVLKEFNIERLGIRHSYDNTIESGLGSSASYMVGIIGAINKLKGLKLSLSEIAEKAWELEVKKLGLYGGRQDQYIAAYGGVNVMAFSHKVTVTPLARGFMEPLMKYFLLFHLGFNRKSATIQEGFKRPSEDQIMALDTLKDLTIRAIEPLGRGDIGKFSEIMRMAWDEKKKTNKGITNDKIDKIYEIAMASGGLAGKVLGAGGGGHMLFIVEPLVRKLFIKRMEDLGLKHIDFSIDWTGLDVRIL